MSCSTCQKTKDIASCGENLTIGKISENDTDVYVFFKNLATGRITQIEATSDADGVVVADVSRANFMWKQSYEIWVTPVDEDIKCRLDVYPHDCSGSVGETAYTCFNTTFYRVHDTDAMIVYYVNQSLIV